jgi:hypothetical protein
MALYSYQPVHPFCSVGWMTEMVLGKTNLMASVLAVPTALIPTVQRAPAISVTRNFQNCCTEKLNTGVEWASVLARILRAFFVRWKRIRSQTVSLSDEF